jgi:hypothetical protein
MLFTRAQRRVCAWLAMLALVLTALAPTLAQAVVSNTDRGDWVQICSASGMVWIQADPGAGDPQSAPMAGAGMQCPWCSLHSPAAGLPPATALRVAAAAPAPLVVRVALAASPVGVWTSAPARAPPFVS